MSDTKEIQGVMAQTHDSDISKNDEVVVAEVQQRSKKQRLSDIFTIVSTILPCLTKWPSQDPASKSPGGDYL
jgi:hypothetical protein